LNERKLDAIGPCFEHRRIAIDVGKNKEGNPCVILNKKYQNTARTGRVGVKPWENIHDRAGRILRSLDQKTSGHTIIQQRKRRSMTFLISRREVKKRGMYVHKNRTRRDI